MLHPTARRRLSLSGGALVAAFAMFAACGPSVPVALEGVVPEAGAITSGTFERATWAVFTDDSQRGAGSVPHCVAAVSDLDVGVATKCNDPTIDSIGAVAVAISNDRVLIAGWTSPQARSVTAQSGIRFHTVETAPARGGVVSTFAFLVDEGFETLTVEDADGTRLAFRTADDLCQGRC